MRNPCLEQPRTLWAPSTTRTTSRLRRVQHSAVNAIPSCTRMSPCHPVLLFRAGGMTNDAFYCVIAFSWRALHVKGRPLKGIYSVPPHRLSSTAIVTSLTHSPPFLHRWTYWSQHCDAVYVAQCVAFPAPPTTLFTIDADFYL